MDLSTQVTSKTILIGLVGPCVSGKTTISNLLKRMGYSAKVIAQEHSYVPTMWKIITKPQFLVYLDVSYQQTLVRRPMDWTEDEFNEQIYRLRNARGNADLIVQTDLLNPDQVCHQIIINLDNTTSRKNENSSPVH